MILNIYLSSRIKSLSLLEMIIIQNVNVYLFIVFIYNIVVGNVRSRVFGDKHNEKKGSELSY